MKAEDLDYFQVLELETDLFIGVDKNVVNDTLCKAVTEKVKSLRKDILDYEKAHPGFIASLVPLPEDELAPVIISDMLAAGRAVGIGPMGAVAGAVSKYVGELLESSSSEVIVENGGDLYLKTARRRKIGLYTGYSKFQGLSLLIAPTETPLGICTSSGVMGHSLSFGKADTVTVISEDVPLSDACATALGNRIKTAADIKRGLNWIQTIPQVSGALIIIENQLGAWGDIVLE